MGMGGEKGQGGKKFHGNIQCEQGKGQDDTRLGRGAPRQLKGPWSPVAVICRPGVLRFGFGLQGVMYVPSTTVSPAQRTAR